MIKSRVAKDVNLFGLERHVHYTPSRLSYDLHLQRPNVLQQRRSIRSFRGCREYQFLCGRAAGNKDHKVRQTKDRTFTTLDEKPLGMNVGGATSVVHPSIIHLVDSHKMLSLRLAIVRLRPPRQKTISIINCYSPKALADELEMEAFYQELWEVVHSEKSFYKFVVAKFNVRTEVAEEAERRIERFGLRLRNDNGNCPVGLLSAARLFQSLFMKKEGTWESPHDHGTTHAEIDHILTNRKLCLLDVAVVTSFCSSSDRSWLIPLMLEVDVSFLGEIVP